MMTTQVSETSTTLEAVRTLAPAMVARSEEIEHGRRVPPDLVEELTAAGSFRMLVPHSHGGAELDFPSEMQVIEELARADVGGSVALVLMVSATTSNQVTHKREERGKVMPLIEIKFFEDEFAEAERKGLPDESVSLGQRGTGWLRPSESRVGPSAEATRKVVPCHRSRR
jgi:alkylation response protein AidB-like acyl-CoA dehydrogenase